MEGQAEYGFIVNLDAQGSGLLSDSEKPDMRARLYEVSGKAFEQAGIRAPRLYQEDRGDGILSILTSTVAPKRVVGEWLEYLHQNLRESNDRARVPLRLRAGMHIGPVTADNHGRSGRAVDLACRLGNCDTAKAVLELAPQAGLVAVVSDRLYEEVVRPGGRWVEPEHYADREVKLKEGPQTAWFMVPGLPQPPLPEPGKPLAGTSGPASAAPSAPAAPAAAPGRVVNNHNYGSGEIINSERIETINIGRSAHPDGER
ncbi:hypothetical protein [Streptomyces sp. NPDC051554]|uniref:hypothetical protein n=1 Tax=Streptomyces sp. NPDC051554 TaxID=3365656 RepID=UPI003792CAA2